MTIHVDDELLVQAEAQAATVGVPLAHLIADALRASLRRREPRGASPTRDPHARHGHAARHRPRQPSFVPADPGAMLLMDGTILVYATATRRQTTRPIATGARTRARVEARMACPRWCAVAFCAWSPIRKCLRV
jgi:hypothetical protein